MPPRDALFRAAAADTTRATPIVRWTARARRTARLITAVAALVAALGGLAGIIREQVTRWAVPEPLPPPTGIASTTFDRAEHPR